MQLSDQGYRIQGIDVLAIAGQFGLPLYVYDADKIIEKIDLLRSSFTGVNLKIKYAAKALTNVSILKLMRQQGIDVEVVSVNEARLARLAGFVPNQIMYTPSGNAWSEIQEALEMGLQLNVDSLPLLKQIGQTYGARFPVALRINPSIAEGGTFKIQTGHENSKFGIPNQYRDRIRAIVSTYGIPVVGLHIHTGSDFKNSNTFLKLLTCCLKWPKTTQICSLLILVVGSKWPTERATTRPTCPTSARRYRPRSSHSATATGGMFNSVLSRESYW
jgi:diaminopimelate decarboxylase